MKYSTRKCIEKAIFLAIFTSTFIGSVFAAHEQIVHGILSGNSALVDKGFKSNKKDIEGVVHVDQASPSCPNFVDVTPLQAAACVGDEFNVKRLLELHANLENGGSRGSTPIMFALGNKHEDLALVLFDAGARVNGKSAVGMTPLMIAASLGERKAVEKFLRAGADVKQTDNDGRTALLVANDPVIARMLVAFGADTNVVDQKGVTGLHIAAYSANVAMIDFWLAAGASVDARDHEGTTPLAAARKGEAAASARTSRDGRLAARFAQAPSPSEAPGRSSEAIERLTAELNRLIIKESDNAFAAGKGGDSAKALQLWSLTVRHAGSIGPGAEDKAVASMLTYIATLPEWPGLSEEAREHAVRAQYYLGKGKNPDGAAKELQLALDVAPWWGDGYHDLGVIEEARGNYDEAKRRLKTYLAVSPDDPNARAVRDKIIEIDIAKEQEAKVAAMAGTWTDGTRSWTVSVRGDSMTISGNSRTFNISMHEGLLEGTMNGDGGTAESCSYPAQKHPATGKYDAEAKIISLDSMWSIYDVHWHCVNAFGNASNCCLLCTKECDGATLQKTEDWHSVLHPSQR